MIYSWTLLCILYSSSFNFTYLTVHKLLSNLNNLCQSRCFGIFNNFIIYNKVQWLINYSDTYILNSFSKVHNSIKVRLQDNLYGLLDNLIRSSVNVGNIRSKYLKEMLVNIYLLDLYIGISLEKKIIKKKRFNSFINSLNELKKMINS